MRRKDREITDIDEIYKIIDSCYCCRLGFYDNGEVYIVPLNFGYESINGETVLYFHGALNGRKVSLIKKVDTVGFEMDTDCKLDESEDACSFSSKYKSIIGSGKISFVSDEDEREMAMAKVMYKYTGRQNWNIDKKKLDKVCIFKVCVTNMTCKVHE